MLTKLTSEQEKRMEALREKDYSSLIGKEIIWHYPDSPEHTEIGIIIGIDPDLGITIVNKKDNSDYLSCIYGILGMEIKTKHECANIDKMIEKMERAIVQIEHGEYFSSHNLLQGLFITNPTKESCIFNQ